MRFSYIVSVLSTDTNYVTLTIGVFLFLKAVYSYSFFPGPGSGPLDFFGGVLDMTYMYIRNSLLLYTPSVPPPWDCKYDF